MIKLSEIAQKLLFEKEKTIRLMVVEGKFPLPPEELIYIIISYALEEKDDVREKCIEVLKKLPKQLIQNFLLLPDIDERKLFFLAYVFQGDLELLRYIFLHPNVPIKVFRIFSKLEKEEILKILLESESKFIEDKEVIDNLLNNPALPKAHYQKILYYKNSFKNDQPNTDTTKEEEKEGSYKQSFRSDIKPTLPLERSEDKKLLIDEVKEGDEEKKRSIAGKIAKMGVAEKIKLATLGNKEVRGILIKDTNKLVSTAVLKNPRITEGEIVKFSQDKNMPDEIIRMIANDRQWTQNYNVRLNLVLNPKTPIQNAIKFLPSLGVKDLSAVAKSKNVPTQLSTMARKIMITRKG